MAEDAKIGNWQLISVAFTAGAFIISLFNYLSQEENRVITKEIDKLTLEEKRDKKAQRLAAKTEGAEPSYSDNPEPESSSS